MRSLALDPKSSVIAVKAASIALSTVLLIVVAFPALSIAARIVA
jgi:hypothetical protein